MISKLIDWLDWKLKLNWVLIEGDSRRAETPIGNGVSFVECTWDQYWFHKHTLEKRPASPRKFSYYRGQAT